MTGFLVSTVIVVVAVLLLRYWRKREMEAFLETDLSVLDEFAEREKATDGAGQRDVTANVVNMPAGNTSPATSSSPAYQLREEIFDDVHRSCLKALDQVIQEHHRVFVHVPLQDLVRSDPGESRDRLQSSTLSFLLCDRNSLAVVCGIHLKGAGSSEVERHAFVEEVFRQIDKPLITLPMVTSFSALEVEESLAHILKDRQSCPRCGRQMVLREAVKGKNAGKKFRVCERFPECRGFMRIGHY